MLTHSCVERTTQHLQLTRQRQMREGPYKLQGMQTAKYEPPRPTDQDYTLGSLGRS